MDQLCDRRKVLKSIGAACAAALLPPQPGGANRVLRLVGQECELRIASVSDHTMRLTALPIKNGRPVELRGNGFLIPSTQERIAISLRSRTPAEARNGIIKAGGARLMISDHLLTLAIQSANGSAVQQIKIDEQSGVVSFVTGDAPLLGLGQGGPQFDRRGSTDAMRSGQGGYRLATHGARVPVPWLIGTTGWAMFFHQPFGTFDFTGPESKFQPASPQSALPLDLFVVASREPATIMAEYARLTGHAEMPPLWSFGYQQSHRTLGKPAEILGEAKTFREKRLPCDAMIYLGTGFCPNGWNTENGSFAWNSRTFPDPKGMIGALHKEHFRVVPHVVILANKLQGSVHDPCELRDFDEESAACYWDMHRQDFAMGVDGWWPDEGDPLDVASRLVRNRMYWEGPQIDRPNERPFALHRNGYAGMQRYASFLWSGDVYSTWETLKTHVPIAINTALSGIPYWGTDIGGFVPTKEFTAELYLRWFQFGAFCTLFRCHGRTWKLRLPWGWDTGDPGPIEIRNYDGEATPDASQLHNERVEPICRKYLELRYRMLPYLYSAVRECATTGMPVLRALWLHYPDDPVAVACSDEYLWGRDVLVAPVVEQGATSRRVYLPRGHWYDFWTNERIEGGRGITRGVDWATLPLYVRAGAILPLGPVKQYVTEKVDEPLSLTICPGADGSFRLYEDDGASFDYRRGEWMGIDMEWADARRSLSLRLAKRSRMLPPLRRAIVAKVGEQSRSVAFEGRRVEAKF
jgi:alpha-glucosidase (family GH31 glycosyl hydrolase)